MKRLLLFSISLLLGFSMAAQSSKISTVNGQVFDRNEDVLLTKQETGEFFIPNRDAIWSDDFSDPDNWVMTNTSTPPVNWEITTNVNSSPVAGLNPINLPTAANGFAIINGDVMGDGSIQNSSITTANSIDLSDHENIQLRFAQVTRNWSTIYTVRVSNDGGATWTDYNPNPHITVNTNSGNPEWATINISDVAGGQSNVKIQFNYQADWGWFWAIDDVFIEELSPVNISAGLFHYTLQNTAQPVDAIGNDTLFFAVNVNNAGLGLDIKGTAEVVNTDTEEVVFTQSKVVSVPASTMTVIEFDNAFPLEGLPIGNYMIRYHIEDNDGGEDLDPSDNTRSYPFRVTADLVVTGADQTATLLANVSATGWGYGTSFWGPTDPNIFFRLTQVHTGFSGWQNAGDLQNAEVNLFLVEKGPQFHTTQPSFSNFTPEQMTILGYGNKTLTSGNHSTTATPVTTTLDVQRFDFEPGPIIIEAGKEYFVIALVPDVPGANNGVAFRSTDGTFPNYVIGLDANGEPLSGFVYTNNRIYNNDAFTANFGGRAPFYYFNFEIATNANAPQLDASSYSIYPNPVAGDHVNLELNFERPVHTYVYITDIQGKLISTREFNAAQSLEQLNVSGLAAGTYMVIISNELGVATSKITVVR